MVESGGGGGGGGEEFSVVVEVEIGGNCLD